MGVARQDRGVLAGGLPYNRVGSGPPVVVLQGLTFENRALSGMEVRFTMAPFRRLAEAEAARQDLENSRAELETKRAELERQLVDLPTREVAEVALGNGFTTVTPDLEAAISLLTIQNGVIPPSINCNEQDSNILMDVVPNEKRIKAVNSVMSNSFGFGGQNVCLIFSAEPA